MTETERLKALKDLQAHPGWGILVEVQSIKAKRQTEHIVADSTPETLVADRAWLDGFRDWTATLDSLVANLERAAKAEKAGAKPM
jgi:hypothetical protein